MIRNLGILLAAAPLAACQSFSFAPPAVQTDLKVVRYNEFDCTPLTKTAFRPTETAIEPNVVGALSLVDNFVLAYRCAEQDLANGRQYFEVPAFLAAAAGLIGPSAFGFTNKDVLKLGAAGAVLGAGNSYYAPKDKAAVVSSALRAVLCVKSEAVGISYFTWTKPEETDDEQQLARIAGLQAQQQKFASARLDAERLLAASDPETRALAPPLPDPRDEQAITSALVQELVTQSQQGVQGKVLLDAERQYFEMVGAALFTIESIMAERLRNSGSANTTEVFAKLQDLLKKYDEALKALEQARQAAKNKNGLVSFGELPNEAQKELVTLENEALQPKLQVCVQQAHL